MSRTAHPRPRREARAASRLAAQLDSSRAFAVMTTIHGPKGWWDVIRSSDGTTEAVCPKKPIAKLISKLLDEHERCLLRPDPAAEVLP